MVNPSLVLPHEVWINILDRIEEKRQLATCRLVCKQWDPIAEKAMFRGELLLINEESFATKLHYHLAKKPALALFIKSVMFEPGVMKSTVIYNKLLKLVMTSSMERIRGMLLCRDTEELFYQNILGSLHKFDRIKSLFMYPSTDLQTKCLLALKNSLEYLRLSISGGVSSEILDCIDEFTKLDFLDLSYKSIPDMSQLDFILNRLQCATQLGLHMEFKAQDYITKSKDQMNAWLTQNVKIDQRMKTIAHVSTCNENYWCSLVDYFAYKYPNLKFMRITSVILNDDLERILQTTKHIPTFILAESDCFTMDNLWTVGYMMKSPNNIVNIRYSSEFDSDDDCACYIEKVSREDKTATSSFRINLYEKTPHIYIKQLLSSVNSGTSAITKAAVDLVHWKNRDLLQEHLRLYDILRLVPDVRDLEFMDATIEYQKLDSGDVALNNLDTLEIVGAKIDHRVITQLGGIAPKLEHLFISSSLIVGRQEKSAIIMPHINLSTLAFQIKYFQWDMSRDDISARPELQELNSVETKMDIQEIMYLSIKTELFPTSYYILKPNSQLITMISEKEFKMHATPSRTVLIECKSLSLLKFRLDSLEITLQFENSLLKNPFQKSHGLEMEEELNALKNQIKQIS